MVLGPGQGVYEIDGSTDLVHWNKLTTLSANGSSQSYVDSAAGSIARRFYRAILSHN